MQINIAYARPDEGDPRSGPATVGWLLAEDQAGVIFDAPERVRGTVPKQSHVKSAARCPAVIDIESRHFQIKCPFDLHLGFERDGDGVAVIVNRLGDQSPARSDVLEKHLHLTDEAEWRHPDRPTIQVSLPYIFVADEAVTLSVVAPWMHYREQPLPGTVFGGRFPINLWPRTLLWAFEWYEPAKDLHLRRGEPLFYCLFETIPQDRAIRMVEVDRTPDLQAYLDQIAGAVNYVNQTFSLFEAAARRRPAKLIVPKRRD